MIKKLSLIVGIVLISACSERGDSTFLTNRNENTVTEIEAEPRFVSGDRIGVYPVGYRDGQPGTPGDIAYPINVPLTYDGTKWVPDGEDYLFSNESMLDLYAYYPYDPELGRMQGKLNMAEYNVDFTMQQSPAIDLLWAKSTMNTVGETAIDLAFRHLFCKITLRLSIEGQSGGDVRLEIYNLITSSTVNLRDGNVTTGTTREVLKDIRVAEQDGNMIVYEAIVPPQVVDNGMPLFLFYMNDNPVLYTTDRSIALEQGMNYTFSLTLI